MFSARIAMRLPVSFMMALAQDLREVCVKIVLTSGRIGVPPQCGQAAWARSCSLMVMGTVTSFAHCSHQYS
jgi:hypothetical protein